MKAILHIVGIATTADQERAKRELQNSPLSSLLGDFETTWEGRYDGGVVTVTVSGLNGSTFLLKNDVEKIVTEKIGNYGRKRVFVFKPPDRQVTLGDVEKRIGIM